MSALVLRLATPKKIVGLMFQILRPASSYTLIDLL
jgi:hypothetical protein